MEYFALTLKLPPNQSNFPLNDTAQRKSCDAIKSRWEKRQRKKKVEGKLNFPLAWSTCKKLTTENLSICHLIWRGFFFPRTFFSSVSSLFRLRLCLRRRHSCGKIGGRVNSNWIAIQFAFNSQLETSTQKRFSVCFSVLQQLNFIFYVDDRYWSLRVWRLSFGVVKCV